MTLTFNVRPMIFAFLLVRLLLLSSDTAYTTQVRYIENTVVSITHYYYHYYYYLYRS